MDEQSQLLLLLHQHVTGTLLCVSDTESTILSALTGMQMLSRSWQKHYCPPELLRIIDSLFVLKVDKPMQQPQLPNAACLPFYQMQWCELHLLA